MDECGRLRELSQRLFQAEQRGTDGQVNGVPWQAFLSQALATDFVLRRSNPAKRDETRLQMIEAIAGSAPAERTIIDQEIRAWCADTLGAVVCPVELRRDGRRSRYRNVQVFTREPAGEWQCVHWQVTEEPAEVSDAR